MTSRPRPQLADPDDPRFRGLPRGDRIHRLLVWSPTAEAAVWTERLLESRGYIVHRVGAARFACGPNGNRWGFAWQIGDGPVPVWAVRLTDLTDAGRRVASPAGIGWSSVASPTDGGRPSGSPAASAAVGAVR